MKRELRQLIESHLYNYCDTGTDPQWMLLIGMHLKGLTEEELNLVNLRYKEKRSEREICRRLHIEKSTYYAKITNIINDIAMVASYEHLINPGGSNAVHKKL